MTQVFCGGYDPKDGTSAPDVGDVVTFIAGGAIPIGSTVAPTTADAGGMTVIECSTALGGAHLATGIYTGKGGSGAVATAAQVTSGLSGRAAVSGDVISVVKRGVVKARFAAQTVANAVTFGTVKLSPSAATAGILQESTTTAPIAGNLWQTLTGGGTTTGTEIVVTAKVNFR